MVMNALIDRLCYDIGFPCLQALRDDSILDITTDLNGHIIADGTDHQNIIDHLTPERLWSVVCGVAGLSGHIVNASHPSIECLLPQSMPFSGERFTAQIPPLSICPQFCIRKYPSYWPDLSSYVTNQQLSVQQYHLLTQMIESNHNIVIAGGSGSGKTTLLCSMLKDLIQESLVILEDIQEIAHLAVRQKSFSPRWRSLCTTHLYRMHDLIKISMRMKPRRLIIGEVRDGNMLDVLKAWNTGMGGFCTLHAHSVQSVWQRIIDLCHERDPGLNCVSVMKQVIHGMVIVKPYGFVQEVYVNPHGMKE